MKAVIICQDEPLFLPEALDDFLSRGTDKISAVFLLNHSANGRRESFFKKAATVLGIFGLRYFLFLSWRFLLLRMGLRRSVADVCTRYGVEVIHMQGSANSPSNIMTIREKKPEVLISIAGSQIFKKYLMDIPSICCLNLHNGALPRFRGLMPVFWAMLHGEKEIGVTIFEMDEGIDTGPIVKQVYVPVMGRSLTEMIKLTKFVGMQLIHEVLTDLAGGEIEKYDNDDSLATYHSFPNKSDVQIFKANGNRLV